MAISRKDEENYFKLCNFNKLLSFSANVLNVKIFLTFEDRHSSVDRHIHRFWFLQNRFQ